MGLPPHLTDVISFVNHALDYYIVVELGVDPRAYPLRPRCAIPVIQLERRIAFNEILEVVAPDES